MDRSVIAHPSPFAAMMAVVSLLLLSAGASSAASASSERKRQRKQSLESLEYKVFPQRQAHEAAVIEWGHSAIISALDAAVATFGPQTSRGAFFEVEAAPVLGNPIDGYGDVELEEGELPGPLKNAKDVDGNMVILTNGANLSGVTLARIAQESGAAALMVVNADEDNPDYIYSLKPESDFEAQYAEEHIDIPVVMVSLTSGNVITTATMSDDADLSVKNHGLPDRVRLYAGGDRPFFEDVSPVDPVVYLIHNVLNADECTKLIDASESKFDPIDDTKPNLLENVVPASDNQPRAMNVDRVTLWKGSTAGHAWKSMEERIQQVTGFPSEHFSDWSVHKYTRGSAYGPHYDLHPIRPYMASITVFLNDVPEGLGGELVYPSPNTHDEDGNELEGVQPLKIVPRRGLAVVHHNTDEEYRFDPTTIHAELPLLTRDGDEDAVKYVAKKWIYIDPLPPSHRVVLPMVSVPFGGKLPRVVVSVHDVMLDTFGNERGTEYFSKLCVAVPILILFGIAGVVSSFVKDSLSSSSSSGDSKSGEKKKKTKQKSGDAGGGTTASSSAKTKRGGKKKTKAA